MLETSEAVIDYRKQFGTEVCPARQQRADAVCHLFELVAVWYGVREARLFMAVLEPGVEGIRPNKQTGDALGAFLKNVLYHEDHAADSDDPVAADISRVIEAVRELLATGVLAGRALQRIKPPGS